MYGISAEIMKLILRGDYGDPFAVLGMHALKSGGLVVRTFFPEATAIQVIDRKSGKKVADLEQLHEDGFFAGGLGRRKKRFPYKLKITLAEETLVMEDPYRFYTILENRDTQRLIGGTHWRSYDKLGAHFSKMEGVIGVVFAVWAPNAGRVSVVGDFNNWDGRRHVMRFRHNCGVWEMFIPGLQEGDAYMFEVKDKLGNLLPLKSDPYAFKSDSPPQTASRICRLDTFKWADKTWMKQRRARNATDAPISIYEVHPGSWQRVPEEGNRYLTWSEMADKLIPYVCDMGFTHIQLTPIMEYPYDPSWGYQPVGLFAATSRFGEPEDFKTFVEKCHKHKIGVFLDWVSAHFPKDDHGLGRFDGSPLYEHVDPRLGEHPDWGTYIYNYARYEVSNFLVSSALFWLDLYHIDGLRADAVASMLYLDYSRGEGEWAPNAQGGNTNLDAINFLRQMNELAMGDYPGAVTIAEESTSWPGVSKPTAKGGLGFGYKWNMGWMHDTLEYMKQDPIYRKHHHRKITFGLSYAWSENFVLPLSHDEVVHLKKSLFGRMPGDKWQQFANLRAYYGFMWGHPGKKLLFMGGEFAQAGEWDFNSSLSWHLLENAENQGIQNLVRDLNLFYKSCPALHQLDCDPKGFQWLKADEAEESYFAWLRLGKGGANPVVVVCNFTPVPRYGYRFGVPKPGFYSMRINTDRLCYGGTDMTVGDGVQTEPVPADGQPHSLLLNLPPLATLMLEYSK